MQKMAVWPESEDARDNFFRDHLEFDGMVPDNVLWKALAHLEANVAGTQRWIERISEANDLWNGT